MVQAEPPGELGVGHLAHVDLKVVGAVLLQLVAMQAAAGALEVLLLAAAAAVRIILAAQIRAQAAQAALDTR